MGTCRNPGWLPPFGLTTASTPGDRIPGELLGSGLPLTVAPASDAPVIGHVMPEEGHDAKCTASQVLTLVMQHIHSGTDTGSFQTIACRHGDADGPMDSCHLRSPL